VVIENIKEIMNRTDRRTITTICIAKPQSKDMLQILNQQMSRTNEGITWMEDKAVLLLIILNLEALFNKT
jgi:hypothetical protein